VSGREHPLSNAEACATSDCVKSSADSPAVRLLIVAGDQLMCCGLRQILEQETGWRVMAETPRNGTEAVFQAATLKPDVALVIVDPFCMGEAALAVAGFCAIGTRVLVISKYFPNALIHAASVVDVGFLYKEAPESEIIETIHNLLPKKPVMPEAIFMRLQRPPAGLTQRETEIIRLLIQGNTSAQTGNALGMSERTIEKQQRKIMEKPGLSKHQDLLPFAVRHFQKESRAPIDTEEQSTLWPSQILSGF
jgi:DNA-binding NarL/FixJ family response regulator